MFPGLPPLECHGLGNNVLQLVHLGGDMARKQCFLACPPLRSIWLGNNVLWLANLLGRHDYIENNVPATIFPDLLCA
jgi:hypothetical protein